MARFSIISKNGQSVRFEGKPRYIGSYLKPSYIEFSEIASPTPIEWEVGDYVDYPRTGLRYKLYSIPQASKNAKKGSHGRAFTYSNVQLHAATKELEIALFRDLVNEDNGIHFSTSPDVATFEDVYGIARRIQACMNDLYPNRWEIRVADFDSIADAEIVEKIGEAKGFALSGGTCLDALSKIYELWQDIGWIHSYENGKDVITIGYANKRISENTTDFFVYGKGNGLTAIKKNQTNRDEFATRLYVYGSERNLPSRYYNSLNIRNAESVDIRNLMLPLDKWGKIGGVADAKLAYLENASAVAKYGVIPKVHYFDSDDAGADIYPSITGITIGQVRSILQGLGETKYIPSSAYNASERVDEIKNAIYIPSDNGEISRGGKEYQVSRDIELSVSSVTKTTPKVAGKFDILTNHIIYQSLIGADFNRGEVVFDPSLQCFVPDAEFTSVSAKVTLGDGVSSDEDVIVSKKSVNIPAEYDSTTGNWVITFKDISAKYDKTVYDGGFPVNIFVSITAEKVATTESKEIVISFSEGSAFIGIKQILEKTFIVRLKQIGFDINERASLGEGKSVSMKSGMCEGRTFAISSCEYIPHLDSWNLTLKRQQDDTLGMLFPNQNYKIESGDKFVLLDIAMPDLYIHAAMDRLLSEGEKLLARASKIQSHYEPSVDAKVMVESGRTLREGMFMQIEDEDVVDNKIDYILIDTLSIYEDEDVIPTYKVTLKERRKVSYKGTPSATSSTSTRSVEEDSQAELDIYDYIPKSTLDGIEAIKDMFYWSDDKTAIGTKYDFFSEKEVSANGLNLGNGSAGGGLIKSVLGASDLGRVAYEDNSTTFNAYAIDYIYKSLVNLENNKQDVDLSDYFTKEQTTSAITTALVPYIKTSDADNKYAPLAGFNTLKSDFDALNKALNDDVSGKVNTWNEIVDFLNEYNGSEDLATILSKMTTDINSRVKISDYENLVNTRITPLETKVNGVDTRVVAIEEWKPTVDSKLTTITDKVNTNTNNISKILGWFDVDSEGNLFTTYNFYSTKEISANGLNRGSGGSGAGLVSSVLGASSLGATLANDNSVVFNAYATNEVYKVTQSNASRIGVLESEVGRLETSIGDGKFLPLTGGKLNLSGANSLSVNRNTSSNKPTVIRFESNGAFLGRFGFDASRRFVAQVDGAEDYKVLIHSGNIGDYALPLSGGTITTGTINSFVIKRSSNNAAAIRYENAEKLLGYIGIDDASNPSYYDVALNQYTLLHSGNIGDYTTGAANKLATARTIWGQSFDGTRNVRGHLTLGNDGILGGASSVNMLIYDSSNTLYLGYGMNGVGGTVLCGNALAMRYGESRTMGFLLNSSGNVTIGASDLAGTDAKLFVDGVARIQRQGDTRSYYSIEVGDVRVNHIGYDTDGFCSHAFYSNDELSFFIDGTKKIFTYSDLKVNGNTHITGNVGIGTTDPQAKLDVAGTLRATDAVTFDSTTKVTGELTVMNPTGIRWAYGSYGTLFRNDGSHFYILFTDSGQAETGSWNSLRPFRISLTTGDITMEHNLNVTGQAKIGAETSVKNRFVMFAPYAESKGVSFGYMKPTIANQYNVGVLHIGTNYGGTDSITDTSCDMTAISIYRSVVGIGKEYDYASIRAIYNAGADLGVTKGILVGSAKLLWNGSGLSLDTNFSGTSISASGAVTMSSTLSVTGDSTFEGNITCKQIRFGSSTGLRYTSKSDGAASANGINWYKDNFGTQIGTLGMYVEGNAAKYAYIGTNYQNTWFKTSPTESYIQTKLLIGQNDNGSGAKLQVNGGAFISGALSVTSTSTFTGATTHNGGIVSASISNSGNITIAPSALGGKVLLNTTNYGLTCTGGALSVGYIGELSGYKFYVRSGNAYIEGNTVVTGSLTIGSHTIESTSEGLKINGNLFATGEISANKLNA